MTADSIIQVKAFARQDGFILSLVWIASLMLICKAPTSSLGPLLVLCTPFFIAWRMKMFRNYALGGSISFRKALAYCCLVFFNASIIFALGQYLYFAFLDNGSFYDLLSGSIETLKPYYAQQGIPSSELDATLKMIKEEKPIELAFIFMMNNFVIGAIASPIIALICKKRRNKLEI